MVNFGLLAAEILSLVWGTPANFIKNIMVALLHRATIINVKRPLDCIVLSADINRSLC